MKVITRFPLEACRDCGHEHIGGPCGMTFGERMKTVRHQSDWMPAKTESRTRRFTDDKGVVRTEKEFYDDEALTAMFGDGLTGEERKEELMEDTKGVGFATRQDIQRYPELVDEHFLNSD